MRRSGDALGAPSITRRLGGSDQPRAWPSRDFQTWYVGASEDVLAVITAETRLRWRGLARGIGELGDAALRFHNVTLEASRRISEWSLQFRITAGTVRWSDADLRRITSSDVSGR